MGRNLLLLMLAIAVPAGLLFFRVVLEYVAGGSEWTGKQLEQFSWGAKGILTLFAAAQLLAARHVQRMLEARRTLVGQALQYAAVLLVCLLFSIVGAVLLEAFGFEFVLRLRTQRIS